MKKLLSVFLAAILLVGCSVPKETVSYRQISMDEAITMMEEESGYIILDVRSGRTLTAKTRLCGQTSRA